MKHTTFCLTLILVIIFIFGCKSGHSQISEFENKLLKINEELSQNLIENKNEVVDIIADKFSEELKYFISKNPKTLNYDFK